MSRVTGYAFNRMKPRDHTMYYISDEINLHSHDESVKIKDKPYAIFDRPIATSTKEKLKTTRV